MKVVIYGKEPIDVLEAWAMEKFSAVLNRNLTSLRTPSDPFGPEQVGRVIESVPIRDVKSVDVMFPIPGINALYRTKPTK